jgi:hypothetical protein
MTMSAAARARLVDARVIASIVDPTRPSIA